MKYDEDIDEPIPCVVCGQSCHKLDGVCGWDCKTAWNGMLRGAAVAFGLMGMAEAIRRNGPPLVVRECWTSEIDGRRFYTCFCPGCGAYMKYRKAGEDEGTDNEWCGACRYGG